MNFDIRHIEIPFRFKYGHSLKQHHGLNGVVCIATDESGNVGYGEAVPREYVTGESCKSILTSVERLALDTALPMEPGRQSFAGLKKGRAEFANSSPDAFPSCALSAIDTARCDLLARKQDLPLGRWLGGQSNLADRYCASIGFGKGAIGRLKTSALLMLYKKLGFRRFKVKVGNDSDESRLVEIRRKLGDDVEIFADANAAWDRETAIQKIEMLERHGVWALEEPLTFRKATVVSATNPMLDRLATIDDNHLANYAWLRERSPLPLIADESLICVTSLERIIDAQAFDIVNIRLSKCGGPLLSAHMIDRATAAGLKYAIAAMVGESPILATAGAHFAATMSDQGGGPQYVQGFSHGLLHKTRFVEGEPKLKNGSVVISDKPGLGLTIDERKLDSITKSKCQFKTP